MGRRDNMEVDMTVRMHTLGGDEPIAAPTKAATGPVWRVAGLIYIVLALCLGLAAVCVIASGVSINYYVPHACEMLECRHPVAQSTDGRSYCSAYPPRDIKFAQVSGAYVKFCKLIVPVMGLATLACAAAALVMGLLWIFGKTPVEGPRSKWLNLCAASPLIAIPALIIAVSRARSTSTRKSTWRSCAPPITAS